MQITCILVIDERNFGNTFKRYYLKNGEHLLYFPLHFWNLHKIFPTYKKKISFIASLFGKLLTPRNVVPPMPITSCFRTLLESKCFHGSQTLVKPALQHFYPNFQLIWEKLSWNTSLFIRFEILGLFGNTLSADHMYSLIDERDPSNRLKGYYLKNGEHFLQFPFHF